VFDAHIGSRDDKTSGEFRRQISDPRNVERAITNKRRARNDRRFPIIHSECACIRPSQLPERGHGIQSLAKTRIIHDRRVGRGKGRISDNKHHVASGKYCASLNCELYDARGYWIIRHANSAIARLGLGLITIVANDVAGAPTRWNTESAVRSLSSSWERPDFDINPVSNVAAEIKLNAHEIRGFFLGKIPTDWTLPGGADLAQQLARIERKRNPATAAKLARISFHSTPATSLSGSWRVVVISFVPGVRDHCFGQEPGAAQMLRIRRIERFISGR
jgi:hypothetical protein